MHGHVAVLNNKNTVLIYVLNDNLTYTAIKNLDKIKEFFKALDTLSIEDYLATVRSFVICTLRGTGQNKYTIKNVCKISPTRRRSMYNEALSTASNVSDTWYNTNNNEGHGVSF